MTTCHGIWTRDLLPAAILGLALLPAIACGGGLPVDVAAMANQAAAPAAGSSAAGVPVAGMGLSKTAPMAGEMVVFSDASTNAPTAWTWNFGDGASAALQKPGHLYTAAGRYTVRLSAGNGAGTTTTTREVAVSTDPARFNMVQTLSDGAQRTTLAFSGLAMLTGNLEAQSFFPPGKVADYTGFQYLRDNDPDGMGHNTSFLTRIANNVILALDDAQFARLKDLAVSQAAQVRQYGLQRFTLMKAFRRLVEGDLPAGSSGLSLAAVKQASRELYLVDGQVGYDRALLYAGILGSLTSAQKAAFDAMKGKGWKSWPDVTDAQVKPRMSGLPQGTSVAVMTYAGDLFSWYAGSVAADVYFCPERHGTYFGSFYMKDAPAVGHEGYSIDEQLTATAGKALSDGSAGYVTAAQAALVSALVDTQRANLHASPGPSIVRARTEIATLLRGLLASTAAADDVKAQVLSWSGTYGELDGEDNHAYATAFAAVSKSLTDAQRAKLAALRSSIMSGTYADGTAFDYANCTTPFLYSAAISDQATLAPYLAASANLFFDP